MLFASVKKLACRLIVACGIWIWTCGDLQAQKGGGGGGRGRGSASHSVGNLNRGEKSFDAKGNAGSALREKPTRHGVAVGQGQRPLDAMPVDRAVGTREHLTSNELRKLDHRRQVADHLRQVAAQNGNNQLLPVADRFESTAEQHYAKRVEQINRGLPANDSWDVAPEPIPAGGGSPVDPRPAAGLTAASIPDSTLSLAGRQNAWETRVHNAERRLQHRSDVANRLRTLGETQTNPELLEAAEQLEELALNQYTRDLSQLTEFRDRFDLTVDE